MQKARTEDWAEAWTGFGGAMTRSRTAMAGPATTGAGDAARWATTQREQLASEGASAGWVWSR